MNSKNPFAESGSSLTRRLTPHEISKLPDFVEHFMKAMRKTLSPPGAPPGCGELSANHPREAGFLKVREAAAYLGVSAKTIYRACLFCLKCNRFGKRMIRIKRESLDEWGRRGCDGGHGV